MEEERTTHIPLKLLLSVGISMESQARPTKWTSPYTKCSAHIVPASMLVMLLICGVISPQGTQGHAAAAKAHVERPVSPNPGGHNQHHPTAGTSHAPHNVNRPTSPKVFTRLAEHQVNEGIVHTKTGRKVVALPRPGQPVNPRILEEVLFQYPLPSHQKHLEHHLTADNFHPNDGSLDEKSSREKFTKAATESSISSSGLSSLKGPSEGALRHYEDQDEELTAEEMALLATLDIKKAQPKPDTTTTTEAGDEQRNRQEEQQQQRERERQENQQKAKIELEKQQAEERTRQQTERREKEERTRQQTERREKEERTRQQTERREEERRREEARAQQAELQRQQQQNQRRQAEQRKAQLEKSRRQTEKLKSPLEIYLEKANQRKRQRQPERQTQVERQARLQAEQQQTQERAKLLSQPEPEVTLPKPLALPKPQVALTHPQPIPKTASQLQELAQKQALMEKRMKQYRQIQAQLAARIANRKSKPPTAPKPSGPQPTGLENIQRVKQERQAEQQKQQKQAQEQRQTANRQRQREEQERRKLQRQRATQRQKQEEQKQRLAVLQREKQQREKQQRERLARQAEAAKKTPVATPKLVPTEPKPTADPKAQLRRRRLANFAPFQPKVFMPHFRRQYTPPQLPTPRTLQFPKKPQSVALKPLREGQKTILGALPQAPKVQQYQPFVRAPRDKKSSRRTQAAPEAAGASVVESSDRSATVPTEGEEVNTSRTRRHLSSNDEPPAVVNRRQFSD